MTLPTKLHFSCRPGPLTRRLVSQGFTLIELILVMAMLLIVLSIASPALSHFFRGRTLDSEARRFVSLTRYGQSRAVSEGLPMTLWIDASQRRYGLQAAPEYLANDPMAVTLDLGGEVEIEVPLDALGTGLPDVRNPVQTRSMLPTIQFLPDGFATTSSIGKVIFKQREDDTLTISRSSNRVHYEIQAR